MQKKIAVLLTNDDVSDFAKAFPNDGEKVVAKLRALRPHWLYRVVPVVKGEFPLAPDEFDGYVITGSPRSVNDPFDWVEKLKGFIRQTESQRIPLVGFCFGHQVLAAALGGQVGRPDLSNNHGWGLGFASTHFSEPQAWMQPVQKEVKLLAAHGEQVLSAPARARVIGSNAFCPIAAMAIGQHVFSTEYHPEMSVEFMDALIGYLDHKLPAPITDNARTLMADNRNDDSALFMQWVVNFFEQS